MPAWITHVWNFTIAAQGIMLLVDTIKDYFLSPRIPVLLNLGNRPWTVWRIGCDLFFAASLFVMAWGLVELAPWTESLAYAVLLAGLFVYSTYESFQPLCLREDGMRVQTKDLWFRTPRFLPWHIFKRHEWKDATTLIVNPGWNQVTCLIPEEHVEQVKAIMQQKLSVPS